MWECESRQLLTNSVLTEERDLPRGDPFCRQRRGSVVSRDRVFCRGNGRRGLEVSLKGLWGSSTKNLGEPWVRSIYTTRKNSRTLSSETSHSLLVLVTDFYGKGIFLSLLLRLDVEGDLRPCPVSLRRFYEWWLQYSSVPRVVVKTHKGVVLPVPVPVVQDTRVPRGRFTKGKCPQREDGETCWVRTDSCSERG